MPGAASTTHRRLPVYRRGIVRLFVDELLTEFLSRGRALRIVCANQVKHMRRVIIIAVVKILTLSFFHVLFAIDVRVIQLTIEVKYSSKYPLICLAVVLGNSEILVTAEFIKVTCILGLLSSAPKNKLF